MKKILLNIILIFSIAACVSTNRGSVPLDKALKGAALEIERAIPKGSKIAILNFNSTSDQFSEYVIDELSANLVNTKILTVVDRREIELIRKEFSFQYSGEVDYDSMQTYGQLLGAQAIVSGSLQDIGGLYRIVIRALSVQTGTVEVQYRSDINNDRRVTALLSGGIGTTSGNNRQNVSINVSQSTGAQNGIYTFWPRLRPTRAGLAVNDIFIPQITITKDFVVIHFCRNAAGTWQDENWDTGISGFYDKCFFTLQDLDNPSLFFEPVSQQSTSNGMGRIWTISYKRFNATRLKLTGKQYSGDQQPFVFEEIVLGKPDS
jgi:TolB-like protein